MRDPVCCTRLAIPSSRQGTDSGGGTLAGDSTGSAVNSDARARDGGPESIAPTVPRRGGLNPVSPTLQPFNRSCRWWDTNRLIIRAFSRSLRGCTPLILHPSALKPPYGERGLKGEGRREGVLYMDPPSTPPYARSNGTRSGGLSC